jgi:hypothetical protein
MLRIVRRKFISVNFSLCNESGTLIENQFSGRRIIKAKTPEPGGVCNVERSRVRRAIH